MTAEQAEQKVLKRLAYIANNELLTEDANNLRTLISEFLSLRNDFRILKKKYDELKEAWGEIKEEILTIQRDGNSFINISYLLENIINKHLQEVENADSD